MNKTRVVKFRCSDTEYQAIMKKVMTAEITLSEFMRRVALGRTIKSVVDQEAVGELRRVGGMLKHFYPKTLSWTSEEKRRYWSGYEKLIAVAVALEERIGFPK